MFENLTHIPRRESYLSYQFHTHVTTWISQRIIREILKAVLILTIRIYEYESTDTGEQEDDEVDVDEYEKEGVVKGDP